MTELILDPIEVMICPIYLIFPIGNMIFKLKFHQK